MESIDELIEENRKMIIRDNKLEIHDNISCDWSAEFMDLVHAEAQQLRTQGRINYRLRFRHISNCVLQRIKLFLLRLAMKVDNFLCKLKFYERTLRPCLIKFIKPEHKTYNKN